MVAEIRQFDAVIPAGTPDTAPVSIDMSFPPRVVAGLTIVVPSGPAGLVGFRITNSGIPIIPAAGSDWIITNGEVIQWPLDGYIDSGSWGLEGYNDGVNDHTVYVRFLLDLITPQAPAATPIIPAETLGSALPAGAPPPPPLPAPAGV